jgi:glycosyltransferase involved in cell wall biosynthesis
MKILFINQSDINGGAARAANRLASKLLELGLDIEMQVMRKLSHDEWVVGPLGFFKYTVSRLLPRLELVAQFFLGIKKNFSWSLNLFINPQISELYVSDFDVIHLHWIGKNMIPIHSFKKFNKPIFWSLHDSWAFTGGCHVPYDCRRFEDTCGNCPQLSKNYQANDISNYIWLKKFHAYESMSFHFIAPSRWIADMARASSLLKNFPISVIPNGLDTSIFTPHKKFEARKRLGILNNKNIILFGGINADVDQLKGMDLLNKTLNLLCEQDVTFSKKNLMVVFGTSNQHLSNIFPLEVINLGLIKDDNFLAGVYSAADITIVPSRSESFGQVAAESLSCGTPVAAFNTSGLKDIIDHKETGYLADYLDIADLARGVEYLLNNPGNLQNLSSTARKRAVERFDINVTAKMHLELYKQSNEPNGKV